MAPRPIAGTTTVDVEGLGSLKGLVFDNGVRQFCGIPYATLSKRWTRSKLATSWKNNFHDGTKLGANAPDPPEYVADYESGNDMDPVPPLSHFEKPVENELECLVINIVLPPAEQLSSAVPVMAFIHGGSFICGGSNLASYDCVNLVSYSCERGTPIAAITFNYRVGLGGFLASEAIQSDLRKDGYAGVGNFGLTDQQLALEWVQRYISLPSFNGDKDNVTIYGESAGGISVAHHLCAAKPSKFHRAIAMSGALDSIPVWTPEQHERRYKALLKHLGIDYTAADTLEQLRKIPESVIAAATIPIEGVSTCTGNPCYDGVFHKSLPTVNSIDSPPSWLKSYMVGDVYDEAIIFEDSIREDDHNTLRTCLRKFLTAEQTDEVLTLYGFPENSKEDFKRKFEELAGDTTFKMQNLIAVEKSRIPKTYAYHFDQKSTLEHPWKGTAYHAIDLGYIFLNMTENMSASEIALARSFAGDWIDFAYGKDPWEPYSIVNRKWMVYGPVGERVLKTEEEDEQVRRYGRMRRILDMGILKPLVDAMDDFSTKRDRLGNRD